MASSGIQTKVGLFGADLLDFYNDCAVAGVDVCDPTDYHDYTGWAIGIEWTWSTTPASNALTGVCFAEDLNCIKIKTASATGSANDIKAWTSSVAPAANAPSSAPGSYCDLTAGGFSTNCWFGKAQIDTDKY